MFNFRLIVVSSILIVKLCWKYLLHWNLLLDRPLQLTSIQVMPCWNNTYLVEVMPTSLKWYLSHQSNAYLIKATPTLSKQGPPCQSKAHLVKARLTSSKQMFLILSLISITTQSSMNWRTSNQVLRGWDIRQQPSHTWHTEHSTGTTMPMQSNQPITQSQACTSTDQWIHDWSVHHICDIPWTACPHGTSAQCIHTALLVTGRQAPCKSIIHRQKMKALCKFIKWYH